SPETDESTRRISVGEFVRSFCPTLFKRWEPTWWLNSGHLQTFWSSAGDFSDVDVLKFDRTLLELPDGGVIGVDFSHPEGKEDPTTPIVVVLPGLTGGVSISFRFCSQASYVRNLLAIVTGRQSEGGLGYRGVVVNSRGCECGNVPLRTPQMSAGSPDDLCSSLLYIASIYPNAPIYAVGFSLGATVLAKYLGQEGERSRIRAGIVIACPWDLQKNSNILESRFFYRRVYSRALAKSYLALLDRSIGINPPSFVVPDSHYLNPHLSIIRTIKQPTFTQVNTHLTSIIGGAPPVFPHARVEDFYKWASCAEDVLNVRVPLLCVNADDDPIVKELPDNEVKQNDAGWVTLVVTKGGGHLGWFEKDAKRRWITKPVVEWLKAINEEVVWEDAPSALEVSLEKVISSTSASSSDGDRTAIEAGLTASPGSSGMSTPLSPSPTLNGVSTPAVPSSGEERGSKFVMALPDNHLIGYRVLATGLDPDHTTIPGGYAGL
ncbi:Alpha/Beta hydrolase protein, partial [Cantharellus anzutake]|uniref:Alpha/Beta hydrolase protein n=1 Tax=Cantharellus anzutake TaxID=1750568 RepID=UPI001908D552